MKKLLSIILLCLPYAICLGQSDYDYTDSPTEEEDESNTQQDTTSKESNVKHLRKTWQWEHNGVYKRDIPLDTNFDGVHNYNYIFKRNISNTYLANFPSPYESNIFIRREAAEDFYSLTNVRAYLFKPDDALSYNTTTPFTQLKYFNGGGRGKAENLLDVFHAQNIRPFWNAGFRYNLISSDGRYINQKAKAYNFSFFSSYERERLVLSLFLNQNVGHFNENGGVFSRNMVRDSSEKAENIPVNLNQDVSNNYRNFNFYIQGQYNIGKAKQLVSPADSANLKAPRDTSYAYPAKATFSFTAEDNEHWFVEEGINFNFFPNTYIDSTGSYDLTSNKVYRLTTKFVMNEHPKYKYLPGIYAGLDFKYLDYHQRTAFDSITKVSSYGNDKYSGTYITAGIFNLDTNARLNYDLNGKLCLTGHYLGNFSLQGFIQQALNKSKTSYIQADALLELKSVDPFLTRYIGNHNIWENNFNAIKTLNIQGKYVNTKTRSEAGAAISNVFSYVYFNTEALPEQTSKALMVFTAWGKQNFKAGNFYFDQQVYFQKSTQEDILSLPAIAAYSHNYYKNYFFQNALGLAVGFDVFYNTKYYADNYMPSIMQFYNQRTEKVGNYPKVDVFLTLHIKRADIFAKYEHVNYFFTNGEYFSALDYPINPGMFKFGLRWNFFD